MDLFIYDKVMDIYKVVATSLRGCLNVAFT
jgi:hypothetical protein